MSIISKLHIEDYTFNILRYHWSFHQDADVTGRPCARPQGGLIQIVIETTKDPIFTEWAVSDNMLKNVKIVQSPATLTSKSRTIEFYDMHCVEVNDNFNGVDNQPMTTTITLSPAIIVVNGEKMMEKYWKVTDLDNKQTETTKLDNEPNLIGYYITDVNGEQTKEYDVGDTIILNIETENCLGKTITINLEDKTHDFKHNGIILKNDILKDYIIRNNLEKIELKVIEQE